MPRGPKLRAKALAKKLRIVLIEPEIPPNTGAIARTAAATQSALHLVGKLGFRIDEQSVRRAGLDYWPLVDLHTHPDLDDFCEKHPEARLHLFSGSGVRSYLEMDVAPGDALVFGKESVGLDTSLLEAHPDRVWAIPTLGPVRSLNLSNAAAVVTFEALRRLGALENPFLADDAIGR
ncbi:MAG: tRNA (cytidine(34)-2'-O)-methyltransferase [Myxococcota bacterium]